MRSDDRTLGEILHSLRKKRDAAADAQQAEQAEKEKADGE